MANTTNTRRGRTLPNAEAAAAAEAEAAKNAALQTAREANSATLNAAVADIIRPYFDAETAVKTAQAAVVTAQNEAATKHERMLLDLANWSHANDLAAEMIRPVLDAALAQFYPEAELALPLSTASKLRTQLQRAMSPKVRGSINTVLKPWIAAWEAEAKAEADEKIAAAAENRDAVLPAKPLREKFQSRNNLVNQALTLAVGSPATINRQGKKTKDAVASVVFDDIGEHVAPKPGAAPGSVLAWVAANPKVSRGAKTPTAPTVTAEALDVPKDANPRQIAEAEVTDLINRVNAVGSKYPAATALFASIIEGLRQCTAARLLPGTPAPSANEPAAPPPAPPAAPPAPPAAEVLSGPADDTLLAEFREFQAFKAMRTRGN